MLDTTTQAQQLVTSTATRSARPNCHKCKEAQGGKHSSSDRHAANQEPCPQEGTQRTERGCGHGHTRTRVLATAASVAPRHTEQRKRGEVHIRHIQEGGRHTSQVHTTREHTGVHWQYLGREGARGRLPTTQAANKHVTAVAAQVEGETDTVRATTQTRQEQHRHGSHTSHTHRKDDKERGTAVRVHAHASPGARTNKQGPHLHKKTSRAQHQGRGEGRRNKGEGTPCKGP